MQKSFNPCFFISYTPEEIEEIEKHDHPVESCTSQQDFCIRIQMYGIPLEGATFEELDYQTSKEHSERVYGVFKVLTTEPHKLLAVSMQSDFEYQRFQRFTEPQADYPQGYCQVLGYYAYRDDIAAIRVNEE